MTDFDPPPPPPPPPQPVAPKAIKLTVEQMTAIMIVGRQRMRAINGIVKSASKPMPASTIVELPFALALWVVVVLTVTMNAPVPPDVRLGLVGEAEQVAYCGAPLQLRFTLPLTPVAAAIDRL